MLVRAELQKIVYGDRGMLRGIESCLEQQCLVSAVTLIFAMIDALAALTRPKDNLETNGAIFKDWVQKYSKLESGLKCTADDIWGARCGVLHLHSPISRLSSQGKAKQIYYQWHKGPPANASLELPDHSIIVNVEDLHNLAKCAVETFNKAVEGNPILTELVKHHLQQLLCYQPFTTLVHAQAAAA